MGCVQRGHFVVVGVDADEEAAGNFFVVSLREMLFP